MWYKIALIQNDKEIPEGTVRRFHYTSSDEILEKIAEEGILVNKSESYKYGDPKAVWSNSKLVSLPSVEYWEYPKNIIGNQYQFNDVMPEQIIKLHYSWSDILEYILENYSIEEGIERIEDADLIYEPKYKEVYEELLKIKNSNK